MARYRLPPRPTALSRLSPEQIETARRMWPNHYRDEVARTLGISIDAMSSVAKSLGLPAKKRGPRSWPARTNPDIDTDTDTDTAGIVDPTEDQIAARCLELQTRWTAEDFDMRSRGRWDPNNPEVESPRLSPVEARGTGFDVQPE